jgi:hypothetical protein
MEKKIKKAVSTKAFETAHVEFKTAEYKFEQVGQGFIVYCNKGDGWNACGGDGLPSDEPRIYRNAQLAEQAVKHFVSVGN